MKALEILKKTRDRLEDDHKFANLYDEAIAELEDINNRSCFTCKNCDGGAEYAIHCAYFEQYFPIEIGKCNKWEEEQ